MTVVDQVGCACAKSPTVEPFPPEVEFIISALEAAPHKLHDGRRKLKRMRYHVRAALQLFSDEPGTPPGVLYTRHVNTQAIGFLTDRCLHLSHGGTLLIPAPDGRMTEIACTVLRCRQAAPGWYEGAVHFNREQHCFGAAQLEAAASND